MPIFELGKKVLAVSRRDKRINAFIQGGTIPSFTLPLDVRFISANSFDNIHGLTEIIFTNGANVIDVDPNSGIGPDVAFVVPNQLVSAYEAKYPNRTIRGYAGTPPSVEQIPFELIALSGRYQVSSDIYIQDLGDGRYSFVSPSQTTLIEGGRYLINQI